MDLTLKNDSEIVLENKNETADLFDYYANQEYDIVPIWEYDVKDRSTEHHNSRPQSTAQPKSSGNRSITMATTAPNGSHVILSTDAVVAASPLELILLSILAGLVGTFLLCQAALQLRKLLRLRWRANRKALRIYGRRSHDPSMWRQMYGESPMVIPRRPHHTISGCYGSPSSLRQDSEFLYNRRGPFGATIGHPNNGVSRSSLSKSYRNKLPASSFSSALLLDPRCYVKQHVPAAGSDVESGISRSRSSESVLAACHMKVNLGEQRISSAFVDNPGFETDASMPSMPDSSRPLSSDSAAGSDVSFTSISSMSTFSALPKKNVKARVQMGKALINRLQRTRIIL